MNQRQGLVYIYIYNEEKCSLRRQMGVTWLGIVSTWPSNRRYLHRFSDDQLLIIYPYGGYLMTELIRKIAIDPGFGGFKVAEVQGDQVRVDLLPAVVGIGSKTDAGTLEVWSNPRRKPVKPLTIRFNDTGLSYLVGHNVHRHTRPVERLDFYRLAGGPELRALLYAALYRIINGGAHKVALMIGLPVEVIQDSTLIKDTLRELRSWGLGEHNFTVDGQQVTLIITQIKAMAQPVGSYFAWGLNTQGKWIQPVELLKEPVGVCDIGFNTVDLFAIEQGQVSERYVDGNTLGMHRAAKTIARHVRTEYGVTLSLHQADDLIRSYLDRQQALFSHAGGETDLSEVVCQTLDETFAAINLFISDQWELARQFQHLIITGGGAQALQSSLLRHYPHAIMLPNPVTANAEGLARYSVRSGVLG